MSPAPIQAYLVDDEPLALERLERMLARFDLVSVIGKATDANTALKFLSCYDGKSVDVLFLDIQMPGMTGFELLSRLAAQPFVIFTTAYDEYALRAFEVNSIDYLLKPIEAEALERAIRKLERVRPIVKPAWQQSQELPALLEQLTASLRGGRHDYPRRIASRVGERVTFLDLDSVTHFKALDKLTYAVVNGHEHCVDQTIVDLERRLDPAQFLRTHRSVLVNLNWIRDVNSWLAGRVVLTLKDGQNTQLPVARDRVRILKERLDI